MSDYAYADASFIRLKNIFLSWTISERISRKLHLQNGQIYLQAQKRLDVHQV